MRMWRHNLMPALVAQPGLLASERSVSVGWENARIRKEHERAA